MIKKSATIVLLFTAVWAIINFLPVVPVEYNWSPENPEGYTKWCGLNYVLTCVSSVSGDSYPSFLKNGFIQIVINLILPVFIAWVIYRRRFDRGK